MNRRGRRRRGLLLLSLGLACGGLAASDVRERVRAVERQVGPLVPVVVVKRDLPAAAKLERKDLGVRQVPERYLPRDSLAVVDDAAGLRAAVPVAAGGYLTAGQVQPSGDGGGPSPLRRGERAVQVAVVGGGEVPGAGGPARVDVLVSTERRNGARTTFLALENVELLDIRPDGEQSESAAPGGEGGRSSPTAIATMRVTLRQAVYLTAAQNFAREVRLLERPLGDRRRLGRTAIGADGL